MIPQDLIFTKKKYGAIPSVEGNTLASKSSSPGIDSFFFKKMMRRGTVDGKYFASKNSITFWVFCSVPPSPPNLNVENNATPKETQGRE